MSFKEITHCVQRLEMLEERAGIEVRGLMVSVEDEANEGEYDVNIMGEITAISGSTIDDSVEINLTCYNAKKQVCGTTTIYLDPDDFFGLETFEETIYSRAFPVEIKIVPKIRK